MIWSQQTEMGSIVCKCSRVFTSCQLSSSLYEESATPSLSMLVLPSGLRGQGRAPGQPGIHFNDAVFHWGGMKGKLNVAFAHDAQVANHVDGSASQHLKLRVGERLGGGHNNGITCTSKQYSLIYVCATRHRSYLMVTHIRHIGYYFLGFLFYLYYSDIYRNPSHLSQAHVAVKASVIHLLDWP